MKNRCTVIQISGIKGFLIAGFVVMCAIAGFIIFPAWCCQHVWNYIATFVNGMPIMELKHGALLWIILALITYATFFNKCKIGFVPVKEEDIKMSANFDDIELLQNIKKDIKEQIEKEEIKK